MLCPFNLKDRNLTKFLDKVVPCGFVPHSRGNVSLRPMLLTEKGTQHRYQSWHDARVINYVSRQHHVHITTDARDVTRRQTLPVQGRHLHRGHPPVLPPGGHVIHWPQLGPGGRWWGPVVGGPGLPSRVWGRQGRRGWGGREVVVYVLCEQTEYIWVTVGEDVLRGVAGGVHHEPGEAEPTAQL